MQECHPENIKKEEIARELPAMSISSVTFSAISLDFIHKNEQFLLSDEIFLIHQGKGKLFKEFRVYLH